MVVPKYKRILIKLSGEALAGEKGIGINISTVQKMTIRPFSRWRSARPRM